VVRGLIISIGRRPKITGNEFGVGAGLAVVDSADLESPEWGAVPIHT